jgi:hypothetical protein
MWLLNFLFEYGWLFGVRARLDGGAAARRQRPAGARDRSRQRFQQQRWATDNRRRRQHGFQGKFRTVRIKNAIIPDLGVGFMPRPYQAGGPPISISLASPHSPTARTAALQGWGIISANIIPTYSVASHWAIYSKTAAEAGKPCSGDNWRVARNVMVAPSDAEARDRVFGEQASNRYFFTYMRQVLGSVGLLSVLKPRPDMPDDEVTVQAITDECVIYGSPKTVLDKLVAFREQVGPFGTLLMTGLDWGGPNESWERQSMQILAADVIPKFRQHAVMRAAE